MGPTGSCSMREPRRARWSARRRKGAPTTCRTWGPRTVSSGTDSGRSREISAADATRRPPAGGLPMGPGHREGGAVIAPAQTAPARNSPLAAAGAGKARPLQSTAGRVASLAEGGGFEDRWWFEHRPNRIAHGVLDGVLGI